jgi:hypothetical protein
MTWIAPPFMPVMLDLQGQPAEETRAWQRKTLLQLCDNPDLRRGARVYYRDHQEDFLIHWGCPPIPEIIELLGPMSKWM